METGTNDEPVFSNLRLTQAGESRLFASYEIKTIRKDRRAIGASAYFGALSCYSFFEMVESE